MDSNRKWNGAADNSIIVTCEGEGVEETVFLSHTQQNIRSILVMGTNPGSIRFDSTPPPFLADSIRLDSKFQDSITQK